MVSPRFTSISTRRKTSIYNIQIVCATDGVLRWPIGTRRQRRVAEPAAHSFGPRTISSNLARTVAGNSRHAETISAKPPSTAPPAAPTAPDSAPLALDFPGFWAYSNGCLSPARGALCTPTLRETKELGRMPSSNVEIPGVSLETFCHKWRVQELSLFGSVLRDDFGPGVTSTFWFPLPTTPHGVYGTSPQWATSWPR